MQKQIESEQKELNLLRSKGFTIETQLFGKPKIWRTKKMTLQRLIDLSNIYIKMHINQEALEGKDMGDMIAEQFNSVLKNAKKASKVLAIAVADGYWKRKFLAYHFLKNINPKELFEFTEKLIKQSDYQSFMTSIILMNGNRITKPQTIEKTKG